MGRLEELRRRLLALEEAMPAAQAAQATAAELAAMTPEQLAEAYTAFLAEAAADPLPAELATMPEGRMAVLWRETFT